MGDRYGGWAVVVDSTVLGGITQLNAQTQSQIRGEPRSNEIYPRHTALVEQKPQMTFTTEAIAAAIDLCGVAGLDIDSLTNGLIWYAQKHADGAGRASGSVHDKYVMKDGILVPTRLTVEHRGDAALEYQAFSTYDGVNDPITRTINQALPAGIADAERFTLASIELETLTLTKKIRLEIEFGIQVNVEGADSDIWDDHASIELVQIVLRLRGKDPRWFKSDVIPLLGKNITHANTNIYLRKRAVGGTFVADATVEHIKLTMEGQAAIEDILDFNGNATGETSLAVYGRYDGTNLPLVIDTTSALP